MNKIPKPIRSIDITTQELRADDEGVVIPVVVRKKRKRNANYERPDIS